MKTKSALIVLTIVGLSITNMYSQTNINNKNMNERMVTIVKSKAPWYAFDFLLPKKFREVNPIYQKVTGLEFKAYSI